MFLHLLSDDQRRHFVAAADRVAGAPAAAPADDDAPLDGVLPDPVLYGSVVARNVFLLELTQLVMDGGRPRREAVDFLGRCADALEVPSERFDRFKSFAAPRAADAAVSAG